MRKLLTALGTMGFVFGAGTTVPVIPTDFPVSIAVEEISWDTTSGYLSPGEYGPDETGKLLWIYPATSTKMYKGDSENDVTGLTFKSYAGKRYFELTEDRKEKEAITQDEYRSPISVSEKKITVLKPVFEPIFAEAAISLGTAVTATVTIAATSITFAVDVGSGSNIGLQVDGGGECGGVDTSATYGGQGMTKAYTFFGGNQAYTMTWYQGTTTSTGSNNVVINFPSCGNRQYVAQPLSGVDQTTSLDATPVTASGNNTTPTGAITTVTDGAVVIAAVRHSGAFTPNQTLIADADDGNYNTTASQTTKVTAGTQTMDGTLSPSGNWDESILAWRPAAEAAVVSPIINSDTSFE